MYVAVWSFPHSAIHTLAMPSRGFAEIAPGVEFNVIAREWRCKWSEANGRQSLKEAQQLIDGMKDELLDLVSGWSREQSSGRAMLNGKLHAGQQLLQRIVCEERKDLKLVVKMPIADFQEWQKTGFPPEDRFLEGLRAIDGITDVEVQTYTMMNVNLMGPTINVPKA